MNNRCGVCGTAITGSRETVPYDCGLDGVFLENVLVYRCSNCGEREIEVPNTLKLHRTLAMTLVRRPERLGSRDIRFLRKYLGLSGTEFARKTGVDKSTVSRWERVDKPTPMGGQAERLLRVLVMSERPVESYSLDAAGSMKPRLRKMRLAASRSGWTLRTA